MALFGSKESKKIATVSVRPTVVRTQNVAKELQSLAQSYSFKVDKLDFNILDVQTYTRLNEENKESEWVLVPDEELYEIDDESALLNPHFQIKQTYEIEIFAPGKDAKLPCPDLKIAVGANASKCKVYLSIAAGSKIEYFSMLESTLRTTINKRKIRAGILIHIFDEMLDDVVSKISAKARIQETLHYQKSETILIAEGFEPTATTDDALILHYENHKEVDENSKVDYASRGFIQGVKQGELLIEYIKPKPGIPGRNCRGEFMQPSEPSITNEVDFKVDESIRVEEDANSIKYIANENGYIALKDNTYVIKSEMDVGEISFKTTGSINSGVDSDVTLNVSETDTFKDAIGTGMSVEVSEIEIDGNVGSNAKVVALKASIGGQTHRTAVVKADKLDINVHKGKAFGKEISITRLEHGEVNGNSVSISQALGGKIIAKEVTLEICASHVTATASKTIEIKKLQGSENTFIIDPLIKKDAQEGLNENQEKIDKLAVEIREIKKEVDAYTYKINEGSAAFMEIKKRLLHYKKTGVKLPTSFVKKYKLFTSMQEHLKEIKEEYQRKKDQHDLYAKKTVTFQDNILDARVINRDRWKGYNEIKFKLIEPPIELVHKPAEGSLDMIFGLVDLGDGEFEIRAMEE